MPLRAQVDGVWLNAALLSQPEWEALKERSIRMPCCDVPAYRRTSSLGTRHFVHSPGSHCGAEGESSEHLAAKAEVVRACHELGWDVQTEFACQDWRADVYATQGRHRAAFEIQWSPQTFEVTQARHAAYGEVKCCWLFRKLPRPLGSKRQVRLIPERDLPIFELSASDSGFMVAIDQKTMSLRDFVKARLERRIRFCEQRHYTSREVHVIIIGVRCWRERCHASYDVLYTRRFMRSDCGVERVEMVPGDRILSFDDPYCALRNWAVLKKVFAAEAKQLQVSVKRRWSQTAEESYWSFGCPECDALYGNHFIWDTFYDAESNRCIPSLSKQWRFSKRMPEPHWCFPHHSGFCTM